ncbi:MAG: tRNA (adenosine(37)-N6)-threonylcarbamoyltransferase complex ATPase subunit type 1 TsaE [Candidatus Nomurabacteria bacterium]|jgi:tRNA threonylcarbamoyladenosine biosynthesis protein TsaE|nr:tRNA (adenosine(37)-N6)-threonylcarbamoyltransferase complex ATPase subunit type 1 TsaE [Candidatus Nomurabacteria bacterium]
MDYTFYAKTTDETREIGRKIAEIAQNDGVLLLGGDLGAGKTTLSGGIGEFLGISDEITSPSFVVNKKYADENGDTVLSHYDFYRLGDDVGIMGDELREDIFNELFVVIEWGGSVLNFLPRPYWRAKISMEKDARKITLEKIA